MLHSSPRQLRNAFKRHWQPQLQAIECRNLLLFYSVECGLKAAWLGRARLRDTSAIPRISEIGHDLTYWVKELRLPRSLAEGSRSFRAGNDNNPHDLKLAHQAWRYGVAMNAEDERDLVTWLIGLRNWVEQELA